MAYSPSWRAFHVINGWSLRAAPRTTARARYEQIDLDEGRPPTSLPRNFTTVLKARSREAHTAGIVAPIPSHDRPVIATT